MHSNKKNNDLPVYILLPDKTILPAKLQIIVFT